jgi:type IX secretion system PorP/SprF family membrane protein
MNRILLLLFTGVFGLGVNLTAQQHFGHTQYLWNQMAINPAYAGSQESLHTGVFYRNQWAGFEGAPTTENVFAHAPISRNGFGAGVNLVRDRIGISRNVAVQTSFSYKMKFNEGALSFGLSGEYGSQRFDWTQTDPYDMGDQAIPFADVAANYVNFGFGMYFSNEVFFAGVAVPRLLETQQSYRNSESMAHALYTFSRHVYLTAGAVFEVSDALNIQPVAMMRYVEGAPLQADAGVLLNINRVMWVGTNVRWGDSVSIVFDYDITSQLRIGYGFDYTLTRLQGHAGTHEFFLGYALQKRRDGYTHPRFF